MEILHSKEAVESNVDRDIVMAYSTLRAFSEHWPKQASLEMIQTLQKWDIVYELEFDRFIKQRRIALTYLAQEISL